MISRTVSCLDSRPDGLRRLPRGLAAAVLGAALGLGLPAAVRAQPQSPTPQVVLPDFSELAERVGPSVVNIRTLERGRQAARGQGEMDPNMEEFFRRFGIPLPGRPAPRPGPRGDEEPQQRGVGSGFILTADGFIMTNAHVVDGADEVLVTLTDKREFKARIVGTDRRTDVAVVKIEAGGLPFVKVGDVNRLKVGEWVMAIGSPFGLENTVTVKSRVAPRRKTWSVAFDPGLVAPIRRGRSPDFSTTLPSTRVMMSPASTPALSAGPPDSTLCTSAPAGLPRPMDSDTSLVTGAI